MRRSILTILHMPKPSIAKINVRAWAIRICLVLAVSFWIPLAHGTFQIPDLIIIDGEEHILNFGSVSSAPFEQLLYHRPWTKYLLKPYRREFCTASWSGFRATWGLQDDKLILLKLISDPCGSNKTEVPLSVIFWPQEPPILASWFSGTLSVSLPESHGSVLILEIEDGIAIRQERRVVGAREKLAQ